MKRILLHVWALAVGLAVVRASPAETPAACLPEDLRLKLAWAEPQQVVDVLAEIQGQPKKAGRRAVLLRRFREAGCTAVDEQTGPGFAEPNLVCRIPGRVADVVAIGTGPQLDGWVAAALLPEIARAVASVPREHGYVFAVLSRTSSSTPSGARALADSFGSNLPRIFVHAGMLGGRIPEIEPEASESQRCVAQGVASAIGLAVEVRKKWPDVTFGCDRDQSSAAFRVGNPNPGGPRCRWVPLGLTLEFQPFLRRGVPVVGWYAPLERSDGARLDARVLVATYRLLAAHAVALDRVLASATAPEPSRR